MVRTQDQRFFILLEEAVRVAETLTVSADDCVDGDLPEDGGAARLQVQESSSWSKLRFQQQQIACGASERFRAKHAEKMIILEKKIDQLSSALVAALCNQMAKAFEPHASEMLASRRTYFGPGETRGVARHPHVIADLPRISQRWQCIGPSPPRAKANSHD